MATKPLCAQCGKPGAFRCTGCQQERYCSQTCQRAAWPSHKLTCLSLRQAGSSGSSGTAAPSSEPAASTASVRAASSSDAANSQAPMLPAPPPGPRPAPPQGAPSTASPMRGFLLHRRTHVLQPLPAVIAPQHPARQEAATPTASVVTSQARTLSVPPTTITTGTTLNTQLSQQPMSSHSTSVIQPTAPPLPRPPATPRPPLAVQLPTTSCQASAAVTTSSAADAPAGVVTTPPTATATASKVLSRPLPFLKRGFLAASGSAQGSAGSAQGTAGSAQGTAGAAVAGQIQRLPKDMLHEVFARLPVQSLAAVHRACREWGEVASADALWRPYVSLLGLRLAVSHPSHTTPCTPRPHTPTPATQQHSASRHQNDRRARYSSSSGSDGDRRPTPPTGPRPANHLVAGVQSVRALRLAAMQAGTATSAASVPAMGALQPPRSPPPLSLLVAAAMKQQRAWSTARYAEYHLNHHSGTVECLAVVDTVALGRVLVSAGWDGAVRVCQLGPADDPPVAVGTRGTASSLDVSSRHGSAGARGGWVLGPSTPQEPVCVRRYQGHTSYITSMAAGRHYIVTGSTDHRVALWQYSQEQSEPRSAVSHSREVTQVRFAYPECETVVLAGCATGTVRLWDMLRRQCLREFPGHMDSVWAIGRLSKLRFVSVSRDGSVLVWPLPRLMKHPPVHTPHSTGPAGGSDQQLNRAGSGSRSLPSGAAGSETQGSTLPPGTGTGHGAEVHETDTMLARLHASGRSLPSDVILPAANASGAAQQSRSPCRFCVEGTPAVGNPDVAVPVITEPCQRLPAHTGPVLCMDLYMYWSCPTHPLWHACCHCSTLDGHSCSDTLDRHTCVHCTSTLVATGGADCMINLYSDVGDSLSLLHQLKGHGNGVLSLRFSCLPQLAVEGPGGRTLGQVPGSHDTGHVERRRVVLLSGSVKEVKVWDPVQGSCLAQVNDHSGPVASIAVSHDHVVTQAMSDGVMVYSCQGILPDPVAEQGQGQPGAPRAIGPAAAGKQVLLKPVISLVAREYRFTAAVLACPQLLAVGHATGTTTLLDFSCHSRLQLRA